MDGTYRHLDFLYGSFEVLIGLTYLFEVCTINSNGLSACATPGSVLVVFILPGVSFLRSSGLIAFVRRVV